MMPNGTKAFLAINGSGFGNSIRPLDTATNTLGTAIPVGAGNQGNYPGRYRQQQDRLRRKCQREERRTVDIATATAGTAIPTGGFAVDVVITPDGKTAYVAVSDIDKVLPLDIATNTLGTAITVGDQPQNLAITPDGKTVYVSNSTDNNVTPIAVATNTPGTAIPTGGTSPRGIAVTSDGKTAYVANLLSNNVTPIDVATNTAGTPIPVGVQPIPVAITTVSAVPPGPGPTPTPAGAPETTITKKPTKKHRRRSVVRFASSIPGSTFTCILDGSDPFDCKSPQDYADLDRGRHAFSVAATAGGTTDTSPAETQFFLRRKR